MKRKALALLFLSAVAAASCVGEPTAIRASQIDQALAAAASPVQEANLAVLVFGQHAVDEKKRSEDRARALVAARIRQAEEARLAAEKKAEAERVAAEAEAAAKEAERIHQEQHAKEVRQAAARAAASQTAAKQTPVRGSTSKSSTAGSGGGAGGSLARIRACESGGNYSTNTGNGYYGAYQFDRQTHLSVGGDGNAADDSPAEQDAAAQRLMDQRGTQPWPVCGRR